jgi:uncharacterized OB-fold protein
VPSVIAPAVGYDDAWFWDGVRDGRLLVRVCAKCGRLQHPPTPLCPACGSTSWSTRETSGRGRLYAWILSRHPNDPDAAPRIVALVELEEGVRLISNVVEIEPQLVRNDMELEVCFVDYDGVMLPQFRPLATGAVQ